MTDEAKKTVGGREGAITLIMESLSDGEWKSVSEVVNYVSERHFKEFTIKGIGMLLSGAVKRNEVEKGRICDRGFRIVAYRLTPDESKDSDGV
jgi:hypothetical protein